MTFTQKPNVKTTLWKFIIFALVLLSLAYTYSNSSTSSDFNSLIWRFGVLVVSIAILFYSEFKYEIETKIMGHSQGKQKSFNQAFFFFVVCTVFTSFILLLIILMLVETSFKLLSLHLNPVSALLILAFIFAGLVYGLFVMSPFYFYHVTRQALGKKTPFNFWFALSVGLMVVVILGGTFMLTQIFGPTKSFDFVLSHNNETIKMTCGEDSVLVAGQIIECEFNQSIVIDTLSVIYFHEDGSEIEKTYTRTQLLMPRNIRHAKVTVTTNESKFEGEADIYVPSYDDRKDDGRRFIGFFLGLFAVALITIPQAVKTIKELWEE